MKKYDLPMQIGDWTLLTEIDPYVFPSGITHRQFIARHKCGAEMPRTVNYIKALPTRRCPNCTRKYHLRAGQRFGSCVVVDPLTDRKNEKGDSSTFLAKLLCDCGKEFYAVPGSVSIGRHTSCGCGANSAGDKSRGWKGHGELAGSTFTKMRRGAETRGHVFDVTIEYLWDLFLAQDRRCALSGVELTMHVPGNNCHHTASLDRIDNSKGYVEGNVQWIHKDLNRMKWKHTTAELVEWCVKVAEHSGWQGVFS